MRDDRVREREAVGSDGTKIDQGGYQAAALAFQRKLAEGGGAGSAGPSYAGAHMPNLADFDDDELDWD